MAVAEYIFKRKSAEMVREDESVSDFQHPVAKPSPSSCSLEEDIMRLREKMEKIFLQEQSFTSDIVMEISRLLDLKIIQYMKEHGKNSQ